MAVKIYNTQFNKIDIHRLSKNIAHDCYSAHIIPTLSYLRTDKDTRILWYEGFVTSFDLNWEPQIQAEEINNSDIDLVIVPFSDHCYLIREQQIDYLNSLTIPHLILAATSDGKFVPQEIANHLNWIFFPYWAITYPTDLGVMIPTEATARCAERTYLFSCLNGHPTFTRLVNLIWMMRNGHVFTWENSIITCPKFTRFTNETHDIDQTLAGLEQSWPEGAQILLERVIPNLPLEHSTVKPVQWYDPQDYINILSCTSAAFSDTYINIITETESPYSFISEKSLKPMINGQLFVTTAVPGTLDLLRDIGFDTFDDIIEHSRYSEYHDKLIRIKALHKRLEEISKLDWTAIFRATEHRRMRNRELALSGNIARKYFQLLEQKINGCV